MYEVKVEGLMIEPNENRPVLMLVSETLGKMVPIEVNMGEALGILGVLNDNGGDKPQTYELFHEFIANIGADVSAVEITDYFNYRYNARIAFDFDEDVFELEARVADAVALAVKFEAPIYISQKVLNLMGEDYKNTVVALDESPAGQHWTEYLNNLKPEDFGKYRS